MAIDFATEATLRALSPFLEPLASQATVSTIASSVGGIASNIVSAQGGIALVPNTAVYEFSENAAVPSGAETTVLTYTVPALKTLSISGWSAWADVDAEYFLKIDGTQKSGARTTIASIVAQKKNTWLYASAGQVVTIRCLRQSASVALPVKAELYGVLTNV